MNSPVTIWRKNKQLHTLLNKSGQVVVWTKIHTPPIGFEHQTPYLVGIIEFEDKSRMPLEIVDCENTNLKPGQKVITVVRRIGKPTPDGVIEYGLKAKPV